MEAISLKLDETMLSNIDENLKKHNYSTRTEFIRTAIRDKLEDLSKDDLSKYEPDFVMDDLQNAEAFLELVR